MDGIWTGTEPTCGEGGRREGGREGSGQELSPCVVRGGGEGGRRGCVRWKGSAWTGTEPTCGEGRREGEEGVSGGRDLDRN